MNTKNGTLGGGAVLDFIGNEWRRVSPYLDNTLVKMFKAIPYVKFIIYVLILFIMGLMLMKLFNIKSPFKGRAIISEIRYVELVKKRDASILRANKMMIGLTNFVEKTPFSLAKNQADYWQYNINRAGVQIPGKTRNMKATEFNALIVLITMSCCAVGLIIALIANLMLGTLIIIFSVVISSYLPMSIVRSVVKSKDQEIIDNFSDYYLMIHYVILASASTPLEGIMKSYAKTTDSLEMRRYVDACVHYIDTYGEYEATNYIARDYREISEVGKLMRLIRQSNEGGNVEPELIGFRQELIAAKQYAMTKRMEKLISRARMSFNILMPILIQAIISAMSIYWKDISVTSTFLGN